MLAGCSKSVEDDLFLGVSYLQARGWVRCRHAAWSFTSRGLREAPDEGMAQAIKLPPFLETVSRVAMPIEAITQTRMAAVLMTLGGAALHEPEYGPQAQDVDRRAFAALLEVCVHRGFESDDAMELARLIRVNADPQSAYDLAMQACSRASPKDFLDVLKPIGRDWLLTDPELQCGSLH
jgi:hypothetical protein